MTQALVLTRARLATPIGQICVITDCTATIRALDWFDFEPRTLRLLAQHFPAGYVLEEGEGPTAVLQALQAYFAGDTRALRDLPVATGTGSDFQREVWSTLRSIPVGSTLSYAALAERIGKPRAVRAVGLANGQNPVALVVPCHRVIGKSGALTGYAGGLDRKRWLLEHEGVPVSSGLGRPKPNSAIATAECVQP